MRTFVLCLALAAKALAGPFGFGLPDIGGVPSCKLCITRVILILMKVGILTSTWFQNVPFCSLISEQFLFSFYDHSFRCP